MAETVVYVNSEDIYAFPSSNSVDDGKLTLEENMSAIVTRITKRCYTLGAEDFMIDPTPGTVDGSPALRIHPGLANIAGYYINCSFKSTTEPDQQFIFIKPPAETGTQIPVGIKLAYDSSGHILGDVGIVGETQYLNGVYFTYLTEEQIKEDDTLVLGYVDWSGTEFSNITQNPDKTTIIDTDTIIVEPGVNLKDFIDNLPNVYVQKKGDFMYGNLTFRSSFDSELTGISLGVTGDTESTLTLNPASSAISKYTAALGANTTRPFLKLGYTTLSSMADQFVIEGEPINLRNATSITDTLEIITSGTGMKANFQTNAFTVSDTTDTFTYSTVADDTHIGTTISSDVLFDYTKYETGNDGLLSITSPNGSQIENTLLTRQTGTFRPNLIKFLGDDGTGTFLQRDQWVMIPAIGGTESFSLTSEGMSLTGEVIGKYVATSNIGTATLSPSSLSIVSSGSNNTSNVTLNGATISHDRSTDTLTINPGSASTKKVVVNSDFTATRVFMAVYNDYAELFEKNEGEIIEPGDVVELDSYSGKYRKCRIPQSNLVVGVCSDTYGLLLGGKPNVSEEENLKTFTPVGTSGRVWVKADEASNGVILPGDILVSSPLEGYAMRAYGLPRPGTVIGKAITPKDPETGKVQIVIALG